MGLLDQPVDRDAASGWHASLDLRFAPGPDRTLLAGARHRGPLRVQRPFHPQDDGTCHVYLLHPPGGLVGGDRLDIACRVETGARALVTTPAAGKFYRSAGRTAAQHQRLSIAAGASLEWLPQENIFFSGSWSEVTTQVELAPGARFLGWDVVALGRPAAGEAFATGRCAQRFELWQDGEPLWIERGCFDGGSDALAAPWGLAGHSASGVLVAAGATTSAVAEILDALRGRLDEALPATRHGVTTVADGEVVVCRALAPNAEELRRGFAAVWRALRPVVVGGPAVAPRVWAT
jgi:urease accessory protein